MKLDITASDKPKQKDFSYSLEISDKQILTTACAVCGMVLLGPFSKAILKSKSPY